jgi:hypothetical protein
MSTFDTSLSMISHASSDYAAEEQEDSFDAERSAFAAAPPFHSLDDRSRQPSRASAGLGTRGSHADGSHSLRERKLEVNWKAFEVRPSWVGAGLTNSKGSNVSLSIQSARAQVLQRQNEVLSCRLKELQV